MLHHQENPEAMFDEVKPVEISEDLINRIRDRSREFDQHWRSAKNQLAVSPEDQRSPVRNTRNTMQTKKHANSNPKKQQMTRSRRIDAENLELSRSSKPNELRVTRTIELSTPETRSRTKKLAAGSGGKNY